MGDIGMMAKYLDQMGLELARLSWASVELEELKKQGRR